MPTATFWLSRHTGTSAIAASFVFPRCGWQGSSKLSLLRHQIRGRKTRPKNATQGASPNVAVLTRLACGLRCGSNVPCDLCRRRLLCCAHAQRLRAGIPWPRTAVALAAWCLVVGAFAVAWHSPAMCGGPGKCAPSPRARCHVPICLPLFLPTPHSAVRRARQRDLDTLRTSIPDFASASQCVSMKSVRSCGTHTYTRTHTRTHHHHI